MPVARAKGAKGRCDKLFSLIIRSEGQCMRCGEQCHCPNFPKAHTTDCPLTTSHIVSRTYSATRCLPLNAQCLCYTCHAEFTIWPRTFSHWITETIGSEAYDELKRKAETVTKVDWYQELLRLQALYEHIDD